MPKFRYIVVNKENRQLSGVVDAPNIDTAQDDLKELGFSIISIEESKQTSTEENGIKFEFSGIDNQKKTIVGTIVSEDRYGAFKRLITEYDLDIRYIVQSGLEDAEKEKQKTSGIIDLMRQYQKEVQKNTEMLHEAKLKKIDRNFDKEKALAMRQVDFVLKKVSEFVDKFAEDLNPEDKQRIKDYVNKILRLKNTTNLDYLRNTCKELLKYLQSAEIFTSKKTRIEDKLGLYTETQEMIDTIQRGKDFGIYEDLQDQLERWQSEHIKGKKKIPASNRIKNFFYATVLKFISEDKEIRDLKKKVSEINKDLKQYFGVVIKSKDPEYKKAAGESIKKLNAKKKKLKETIRILKNNEKKRLNAEGEMNIFEKAIAIINGLSGWLLFYYLTYYFVSEAIVGKELIYSSSEIPTIFFLFNTGIVKYILPIVFLLHITTSIKLNFFKKNGASNLVLFPIFIVASFLIVFNF